MIGRRRYEKSAGLLGRAQRVLVGGVNSPVRAFSYVGGDPIIIKSGRGSRILDHDGNEYIDYVLSYGSLILGHLRPEVIEGIKDAAASGVGFGTTHELETALAERISNAIPLLEKVRFTTSGTEAVMGAVRLARGSTGRDKIVKFERSYHGHADYLLARAGSGLAALGLPGSKGVPRDFTRNTILAPYGDRGRIEEIFERYGQDIAAVITEPVGGNDGVVKPDTGFLEYLRRVTKRCGTLLIFDEVITGFRFHFGSAAQYLGINPDIICLGKIIGGGLPIGAYGGRNRIMRNLAPIGDVYQASTFSGNPVVMRAGAETLDILHSLGKDYKRLNELTADFCLSLRHEIQECGIDMSVRRFGNMFSIRFREKADFARFYRGLLERGVYLAPSEHEANFVSFAHTEKDIDDTVKAAKEIFCLMKR
jgi:glutamate-1-semialdehyde 2,1-aminomutase